MFLDVHFLKLYNLPLVVISKCVLRGGNKMHENDKLILVCLVLEIFFDIFNKILLVILLKLDN